MYALVAPLALEYEATLLEGFDSLEVGKLERSLRRLQEVATQLTRAAGHP